MPCAVFLVTPCSRRPTSDAPNIFLSNARAIARTVPNAQLVEIKGCDNWAQYEQPERFNQESIAFLQEA
ncbi:pimeloyl-ACP methyl ester carboxylesterase [Paraburkholderia sp. JPY465]